MTFVTNLVTSGESGGSNLVNFLTDFVTFGIRGSTLVTFVTDLVTFGVQGVKFGDRRNQFIDLWGVRGVNFGDLCD